jgi:putative sterol carrier protein
MFMAFKFPSDQWVKEFGNQINASEAYERSGRDWEGDWIFTVEADHAYPETVCFFIGLYHGKCKDAAMIASQDAREAQYHMSGSFSTWRRVIEGRLDPIQGLMTRKFKLKGNLMKVLRYPKSAKELVNCVSRVPTEFPG